MLDIYRLFDFLEETGLLIQEKCYKAAHPQIWKRNLSKFQEKIAIDEKVTPGDAGVEMNTKLSVYKPGAVRGSDGADANNKR